MKYFAAPLLSLAILLTPSLTPAQAQTRVTLTPAQQTKIDQIRRSARSQIQPLFSSAQRERYASLRQRGVAADQAIEMIDLSRSQRDRLRQILRTSRSQMVEVLGQP